MVLARQVKVSVQVKRHEAIVRQTVYDERGRVVGKYGLSSTGAWVKVPEGARYPDECLLSVRVWDWLVPAAREIKWALREWLGWRRLKVEGLWARCKAFCRRQRRRWLQLLRRGDAGQGTTGGSSA